jgi:hypothetical protein
MNDNDEMFCKLSAISFQPSEECFVSCQQSAFSYLKNVLLKLIATL